MPIFQHYKTFQTKFHDNKRNLHFNKIDASAHIQKLFLIFPNDFFFIFFFSRPLFILSETIPFIWRGVDFHLNFGKKSSGEFQDRWLLFRTLFPPFCQKNLGMKPFPWKNFWLKFVRSILATLMEMCNLICSHRCIEIHSIGSFRIFMKNNLIWKFWVGGALKRS